MKHIKPIRELYKSTFKSAADQLKTQHPSRSSNLMKWSHEKGESEFKKKNVDRDWPHPFEFKNKDLQGTKDNFLGKFYITGSEERYGLREGYHIIRVKMMSEWGNHVVIEFIYGDYRIENDYFSFKIKFGPLSENGEPKYVREKFLFDNRKDALQFKKYLVELDENDELDFAKDPNEFRINNFYTTE